MLKYMLMLAMAMAAVALIVPASGQNVTTDVGAIAAGVTNSTLDGNLDAADLANNDTKPAVNVTDVPTTEVPTVPTTTSTAAPPSLPIRLEIAAPDVNSYSLLVPSTTDKYCILVTSAVQFTVVYPGLNKTVLSTTFNAGGNSSVISGLSTCGNQTVAGQPAILGIEYTAGYAVVYTFAVDPKDTNKYALADLTLMFSLNASNLFPGSDPSDVRVHTLTATLNETFVVSKDHSYRCDVEKSVELIATALIGPVDNLNGTAGISSFKFAAFGHFDKDGYGEAEECSDDFTTSDIVPIAVGCALAALVVIVLIAYLIGRRRSRQKGYQSV